MNRKNRIKVTLSLASLAVAAAFLVRIWRYAPYSPIRGVFFANNFYGMVHVAQEGTYYGVGELPIQSALGKHVYSSSSDIFRSIFGGIISILAGVQSPEDIASLLHTVPWQGLLFFPAAMLCAIDVAPSNRRLKYAFYGFVVSFSLLGTYQIIYLTNSGTTNAGIGWAVLLLLIWIWPRMLSQGDKYRRNVAIYLVLTVLIVGWYHTIALIFLLQSWSLGVLTVVFTSKSRRIQIPVITSTVTYLVYMILTDNTYFTGYLVSAIRLFRRVLVGSEAGGGSIEIGAESLYSTPAWVTAGNIIPRVVIFGILSSYGLYILKVLWTRRTSLIREPLSSEELKRFTPAMYLAGTGLIAMVILANYGLLLGLQRGFQYSAFVAPIALGILLREFEQDGRINWMPIRRATIVVVILALLLPIAASTAYLGTPAKKTAPTHSEYGSAEWISSNADENDVFFTDYRLLPTLLVNKQFEVTSVYPGPGVNEELDRIYYSTSTEKLRLGLSNHTVEGQEPEYLLLSKRMTDDSVKIYVEGTTVEPMTGPQYDKFDRSTFLGKVHSGGDGEVYWVDNDRK